MDYILIYPFKSVLCIVHKDILQSYHLHIMELCIIFHTIIDCQVHVGSHLEKSRSMQKTFLQWS